MRDLPKGYQETSPQSPRRARSWAFLQPAGAGGCGLLLVTNNSQCQHCSVSVSLQYCQKREPSLAWDRCPLLVNQLWGNAGSHGPKHPSWCQKPSPENGESQAATTRQPPQEVSIMIMFLGQLFQSGKLRASERSQSQAVTD